jgi:UDP-glucose 4-epimerase
MVYLVTGGAGFIGSHLVEALVEAGESVRVLDNLSTGRLANLHAVRDRIDLIQGDVRDPGTVERAVTGSEVILHHAAIASVPQSMDDPRTTYDVNATGTLNVLLAARAAGTRRVVYASSSAVYGDDPKLPKQEALPPAPRSPYAVCKLVGEELCRAFTATYGLSTVCLRYFNVFGPRQDPRSPYAAVIPRFVACLYEGIPLPVYGDGKQTRDFVSVASVVAANLQAAQRSGIDGAVFNIASGKATSLLELADALGRASGRTPELQFLPERPGDVRDSFADIGRATQALGLSPAPLADGLKAVLSED